MRTIKAWSMGLGAWGLMMVSAAFGQTASDLNEGFRVVKQSGGSAYTLQWWGKQGRSYFLEQSPDLVNWTYAPVVFGGAAQVSGLGLNTTAERLFWRLRHTDAQNGGNAQLADFDSDGVSNLDEVTTGQNPFGNTDGDSNGLPDDWEEFNEGKFACYSGALNVGLAQGSTTTRTLTLRNDTDQAVNWTLGMDNLLASRWLNSNTGGPSYTWEEISTTGTQLLPASVYIDHTQPVSLNLFTFPFFGTNYSTFQVSTEGYIDFTNHIYFSINRAFPAYDRPPSMIAGFWDNLDPNASGDIYFQEFSDHCVIEYKDVKRAGWPGTVTFQIVLFSSGAFEFRYHTIATAANSCTVGYQNQDYTIAETLVYNENFLTSNMRLRWERLPFLSTSATSGTVAAHSTVNVTLTYDATNTEAGSVHYPAITLSHSGTGGSPRRLPASLTVTGVDGDNDGLPNYYENAFGLDPALNDAGLDRDLDGLTNYQEYLLGTVPNQPDSDYDEMNDGWEQLYGFPPLVNNATDADPTNDLTADPDSDGLLNTKEEQIGTNPRSSDTDGDTYSDAAENAGTSNGTGFASTPPNPGGNSSGPPAAPLPPTVEVSVQIGDHSVSNSEKYKVVLEPLEGDLNTQKRTRSNSAYGEVQTRTFSLPAGAKYKVTLEHAGTDPKYKGTPRPDYDYTLSFSYTGASGPVNVVTQDPQLMLGAHDEGDDFYATNRSATLNVAWLTSETVATVPSDRKRTKFGVGEDVNVSILPYALQATTWELLGNPGTSTLDPHGPYTRKLIAGERACQPQVKATINGKTLTRDFNVIEPTGVVIKREPGTGVRHANGFASVGFKGRPSIHPTDVSFMGIQVREGTCTGVATGCLLIKNGEVHQDGIWSNVTSGSQSEPSKVVYVDTISTGDYPPPFAAGGAFSWQIPWLFKVSNGSEKQFTTVSHEEQVDSQGGATITKGSHSETKAASDPTSTY